MAFGGQVTNLVFARVHLAGSQMEGLTKTGVSLPGGFLEGQGKQIQISFPTVVS